MTEENRDLLHHYVESYVYPKMEKGDGPDTQGEREEREDPRGKPPMLELSTFYSVVFSPDGEVLAVDNEDISAYSEEELTRLAEEILSEKKEEGIKERLLYQRKDKGDYILVAFLDNTLMLESAGTLVSYTLIFGGMALVLLFFLANYLAGRIVAPLEEKEEIWVNGNSVELKQLISILIDNGIRHGSQGKEVCLELKRVKNSAVLSVANEGREIPEEQRKHLFERFYRRDQARAAEMEW